MSSLLLLNVLDVARSFGETPSKAVAREIANWLIEAYAKKGGGGFNYNPAINTLFDLFRGAIDRDAAVLHCMTRGNPKGRSQNVQAIKTVAPYAAENISTCYRIDFSAVALGRVKDQTVYAAIKAPMVRVVHDEAFVVLPGFRMSYRPNQAQIDLACSIALANLARDDFAGADFEYLSAGPGVSGQREFQAVRGRDRTVYDRDQLDLMMHEYVRGVAIALEEGIERRAPNLRGYRIIDPREPDLFA
ncbi:hypothetical protein [Methylopila turkensis]|uniref:Uncharacterized protein n=1 Tax=Methylopila turkensis TaxID=1437816 RepID=A0A9W6N764_9HYPH|nr:hypothetical protein [Methylopila turkensis]GLK80067.1 hypothetical protein GCM10008174_18080 [Methylopila turkensis]